MSKMSLFKDFIHQLASYFQKPEVALFMRGNLIGPTMVEAIQGLSNGVGTLNRGDETETSMHIVAILEKIIAETKNYHPSSDFLWQLEFFIAKAKCLSEDFLGMEHTLNNLELILSSIESSELLNEIKIFRAQTLYIFGNIPGAIQYLENLLMPQTNHAKRQKIELSSDLKIKIINLLVMMYSDDARQKIYNKEQCANKLKLLLAFIEKYEVEGLISVPLTKLTLLWELISMIDAFPAGEQSSLCWNWSVKAEHLSQQFSEKVQKNSETQRSILIKNSESLTKARFQLIFMGFYAEELSKLKDLKKKANLNKEFEDDIKDQEKFLLEKVGEYVEAFFQNGDDINKQLQEELKEHEKSSSIQLRTKINYIKQNLGLSQQIEENKEVQSVLRLYDRVRVERNSKNKHFGFWMNFRDPDLTSEENQIRDLPPTQTMYKQITISGQDNNCALFALCAGIFVEMTLDNFTDPKLQFIKTYGLERFQNYNSDDLGPFLRRKLVEAFRQDADFQARIRQVFLSEAAKFCMTNNFYFLDRSIDGLVESNYLFLNECQQSWHEFIQNQPVKEYIQKSLKTQMTLEESFLKEGMNQLKTYLQSENESAEAFLKKSNHFCCDQKPIDDITKIYVSFRKAVDELDQIGSTDKRKMLRESADIYFNRYFYENFAALTKSECLCRLIQIAIIKANFGSTINSERAIDLIQDDLPQLFCEFLFQKGDAFQKAYDAYCKYVEEKRTLISISEIDCLAKSWGIELKVYNSNTDTYDTGKLKNNTLCKVVLFNPDNIHWEPIIHYKRYLEFLKLIHHPSILFSQQKDIGYFQSFSLL